MTECVECSQHISVCPRCNQNLCEDHIDPESHDCNDEEE